MNQTLAKSPLEKAAVYWELMRPSTTCLFFLGILLGAVVVVDWQAALSVKGLLAALSGTLVGSASNVINDVFDMDIDRINKPQRPLVSGRMNISEAKSLWIALNITGVALGFFVSLPNGIIASVSVVILYLYSSQFKRQLFIGNLVVAMVVSTGLAYGAVAVGTLGDVWFPIALAFLLNVGREIVKDLEDTEGDRAGGADTIPVRYGNTAALVLMTIVFTTLIAISFVPYLTGVYGRWYLFLMTPTTDAIILFTIIRAWQLQTKENFYRLAVLLKVAMLTGIISIALGKLQ
ncbi:MAG: geranylgeranylglycerol-phosphate geranylgeranyltransferase [Rhizobacter sp.]|nr:geranylgeranylglycerol-phosphate geranylgeranyltransferase [Chlorobiales bacterium]